MQCGGGIAYITTMAAIPAELQSALESLLQSLNATDNDLRAAAEAALDQEWVAQRPDVLLVGLAQQSHANVDPVVRIHDRWLTGD